MVFPSLEFAFFFPVVLVLSWLLMPWPRIWKPFFLIASYLFYGAASFGWAALLAAVTLANQAGAVLIARARTPRARKLILAGVVTADLAVLGVFKYYGFFAEEIGRSLDSIGLGMPLPLLELGLPIGLSFITFQAISYVVDVKRGHLAPASAIDFALYLSLLPARRGRPDRAGAGVHPAARGPARPAPRRGRRRRGADRARPGQEGGDRGLPRP